MKAPKQQLGRQIDGLFTRHRDSLDRWGPEELQDAAGRFAAGGGGTRGVRILCVWAGRVALCFLAVTLAMVTLSNELVARGYATQSTEWLAALDLSMHKLVRRVSHAFELYNTDAARGMSDCLLANPLSWSTPPLCCGCRPIRVARVGVAEDNVTAIAALIDSLYSRVVSPFLLTGRPVETSVDFALLASHVAQHRPDFESGGNVVRTLAATPDGSTDCPTSTARRFDEIFPKDGTNSGAEPPPGQLLLWSFNHLPAVRSLRRLIPRPAYFGQRTERLQLISLLIAGRRNPQPGAADRRSCDDAFHAIGDFSGQRALAYAVALSGRLTVRLAPKAACCGGDASTEAKLTLAPGRALFLPTDCYDLGVRRESTQDSPALLYIGFLYNGAHQAKRKTL